MKRKKFDYTLYADSELSKLFFRYLRYSSYSSYIANKLFRLISLRLAFSTIQ